MTKYESNVYHKKMEPPSNRVLTKHCFDQKQLIIISLIAVVTLSVFWQVLSFDFLIYDDATYVHENPHIAEGLTWNGIRWAFSADLTHETFRADYWQPITFLSRMLDIQLFGLNPSGHHATNLILHLMNAILVFLILLRLTNAYWQSTFVALLFAIHPLQGDSVSWITARKDSLGAFFGLFAIWAYLITWISEP